jgi:hypothetical protein
VTDRGSESHRLASHRAAFEEKRISRAFPLLLLHYLESGLCHARAVLEQRLGGTSPGRREAA